MCRSSCGYSRWGKIGAKEKEKDEVREVEPPLRVFNSPQPLPIYQGKWLALMGQNDMQCLAEAICLHLLPLMLLVSIMGYPNEVHWIVSEAEEIINTNWDPVKKGATTEKWWMDEKWLTTHLVQSREMMCYSCFYIVKVGAVLHLTPPFSLRGTHSDLVLHSHKMGWLIKGRLKIVKTEPAQFSAPWL